MKSNNKALRTEMERIDYFIGHIKSHYLDVQ